MQRTSSDIIEVSLDRTLLRSVCFVLPCVVKKIRSVKCYNVNSEVIFEAVFSIFVNVKQQKLFQYKANFMK